MSLTILSVAYPFAPVGPRAVGGAERVLTTLDQALVERGDRSIVVACRGSEPAGQLYEVPLPAAEALTDADRLWTRKRVQAAIDRAVGANQIDLIHMHGLDFADYILPRKVSVVATLHLPIAWYGASLRSATARRAHLCCVSQSQRSTCPPYLGHVSVLENGVEIPYPAVNRHPEEFALVLGRICPEKNAHEALAAGTLADTPVYLAGQVFPYREHQQYFATRLQPLLGGAPGHVGHRFLGPLDTAQRNEVLGRAKCLLHPTLAPETSSLVAMEALATGTPVIAYRSGALPDIVTEGVTGFLVDSVEEMAHAIGRVHLLSRATCREHAQRRFSHSRMVEAYRSLYTQILSSSGPSELYA